MTTRPHVAHVSSAHPWTDNRIHYREGASLVAAGYRVTLVAVESRINGPESRVEVIALPRRARASRLLLGGPNAIARGIKTRARIIHLHDPELLWAVPLLRMLGRKVIYDAHEDLPVQILDKPYTNAWSKPLLRLAANLLLRLARLSDHIIAATDPIASRFPADRTSVVRNYPPLRPEEETASPIGERPQSALYVGAIGVTRGAREMVSMAAEPDFPEDWTLTLAGPAQESLIEELQTTTGWTRTDYRGQVSPNEARDLALQSRVGLVILARTAAYVESLPTKMFEYFAASVPVIASDFPLWRELIQRYDCGLLVDETSPAAIADAVAEYAADPVLLQRHSTNARRAAVESFSWDREVPSLLDAYRNVANSAS